MLYAIVALLVIILDQWTKYWVAGNIVLNSGTKELIPGLVSLVNVHNEGAAFSFLAGANANLYFIAICGVFSIAVIILLATRVIRGELGRWSAVFVMARRMSYSSQSSVVSPSAAASSLKSGVPG